MRCAAEGCLRPRKKRDWCEMHYRRWMKFGSTEAVMQKRAKSWLLLERLNERTTLRPVDFSDPLVRLERNASPCKVWNGELSKGYGRIKISGRKWLTHRAAFMSLVRPLLPEQKLDHLCRQKACWNVEHLEPTTLVENFRRGRNPTYRKAETERIGIS